jgi:hypothetical protein
MLHRRAKTHHDANDPNACAMNADAPPASQGGSAFVRALNDCGRAQLLIMGISRLRCKEKNGKIR